uniref:Uncharacterized protein n=1 Tax=Cucumis melo TaxID=3656 RepID=A0A9I9EGK4_CUCME
NQKDLSNWASPSYGISYNPFHKQHCEEARSPFLKKFKNVIHPSELLILDINRDLVNVFGEFLPKVLPKCIGAARPYLW